MSEKKRPIKGKHYMTEKQLKVLLMLYLFRRVEESDLAAYCEAVGQDWRGFLLRCGSKGQKRKKADGVGVVQTVWEKKPLHVIEPAPTPYPAVRFWQLSQIGYAYLQHAGLVSFARPKLNKKPVYADAVHDSTLIKLYISLLTHLPDCEWIPEWQLQRQIALVRADEKKLGWEENIKIPDAMISIAGLDCGVLIELETETKSRERIENLGLQIGSRAPKNSKYFPLIPEAGLVVCATEKIAASYKRILWETSLKFRPGSIERQFYESNVLIASIDDIKNGIFWGINTDEPAPESFRVDAVKRFLTQSMKIRVETAKKALSDQKAQKAAEEAQKAAEEAQKAEKEASEHRPREAAAAKPSDSAAAKPRRSWFWS